MRRPLLPGARAIPRIIEMTWKQTVLDGFVVFTVIIQPLIVALLALWMLEDRGPDYRIYIVVGSGMTGLWSGVLFFCGNGINHERFEGTLETLAGVPTPMGTIVFGKNLASVTQSLVSMLSSYLLASAIFGYPLVVARPALFFTSLALTVVAFICFGLVLAPIFMLNPQIQQFQNGLEFPVYVVSGFLFPVALLPQWTTPISWVLPTYWGARALHATSSGGAPTAEILASWAALGATCVISLAVAAGLFRRTIARAKRDATLDLQ